MQATAAVARRRRGRPPTSPRKTGAAADCGGKELHRWPLWRCQDWSASSVEARMDSWSPCLDSKYHCSRVTYFRITHTLLLRQLISLLMGYVFQNRTNCLFTFHLNSFGLCLLSLYGVHECSSVWVFSIGDRRAMIIVLFHSIYAISLAMNIRAILLKAAFRL